jgi:hypothetical protein
MIEVHTIEQRTMQQGSEPPITLIREVAFQNGKGVKKIQVLRGNTVVSSESEALNLTDKRNIQRRKTSSLHKSLERKTLKKLNASKKQVATQRKLNGQRKLNASKKAVSQKKAATKKQPVKTKATKARKTQKTKKARRQQRN